MTYWDTSALFKLYFAERDSSEFFDLLALQQDANIFTSAITSSEILCSLHRKEQLGELDKGEASEIFEVFSEDVQSSRVVLIPHGDNITKRIEIFLAEAAARSAPLIIRSLDAIHLATALQLGVDALATTDQRLRKAAALASLSTLP